MIPLDNIGLPVLWANVEPDEYVGDSLEEEEGHHREHGQEGEKVPAYWNIAESETSMKITQL